MTSGPVRKIRIILTDGKESMGNEGEIVKSTKWFIDEKCSNKSNEGTNITAEDSDMISKNK